MKVTWTRPNYRDYVDKIWKKYAKSLFKINFNIGCNYI